ncbi:RES family NAD+ phosphorylase [Actinomadura rugatobispora]|uniref:RES family NAD+ phosphorylase n=1 Tax=Actinomadura rugatobispora TaxID=1994 RepID=A0ABW0ZRG6_9ACTN|nr:hypothetical protein GCM10010200_024810 [Actinomadura rugatobispora]
MVAQEPPADYDGTPNVHVLRAGTRLYRCHSVRRTATGFNTRRVHSHFGGGRFDATEEHPYPYYYAGTSKTTALAETLLRDVHRDQRGFHILPRAAVQDLMLSEVETLADLRLISLLSAVDLAAVAQDRWLIHSSEYPQTRYWGHWLREQRVDAQGIIWESSRDFPHRTLIFFGDRCGDGAAPLRPVGAPEPLGKPAGIDLLNTLLSPYRVIVAPD